MTCLSERRVSYGLAWDGSFGQMNSSSMPLMPLNTHRKFTVSQNRQTRSQVCSPLLSPLLPAVVAELDDVVLVAVPLRVHYEAEKSLLLLLPIDHHPPTEEPVTTVLTGKDKESLAAYKYQKHTEQSRQSVHCRRPHLLDWARSKHSTLVGFLSILWNIDV